MLGGVEVKVAFSKKLYHLVPLNLPWDFFLMKYFKPKSKSEKPNCMTPIYVEIQKTFITIHLLNQQLTQNLYEIQYFISKLNLQSDRVS